MKDPITKLRLLARTEMALGRIQAQRAVSRITFILLALVLALLGLGMLNFSGYQALAVRFSPSLSGLFMAIIDIVLAGVLVGIACREGGDSNEEKMVREIRDIAYSELTADVDSLKDEFSKISDDVHRIRSGIKSFAGGTGGKLRDIVPLLGLLAKAVKKKKAAKKNIVKEKPDNN